MNKKGDDTGIPTNIIWVLFAVGFLIIALVVLITIVRGR